MLGIHFAALVVATIAAFAWGPFWYSPALFCNISQKETGQTLERLQGGNPAVVFGAAFLFSLLAALVFAMFLGPKPSLSLGLGAGLSAGLCWVAGSFGMNYLFERRSLRLFLINGGYHTLQFTLYGLVLGLWH